MKNSKILIAEDNDLSRENLIELLREEGYSVTAVQDGRQAMDTFIADRFDLVVTDLRMPHMDGLELLKFIRGMNQDTVVIIVTGYGTINTAVEAMKLGAFDYVTKPIKDDLVKLTIARALSYARLKEENVLLRDRLKDKFDAGKMIGYSDCMKRVFETIEKVSQSDSTVIIYG
ncbi:MAG: response regulator, partial [Syntrophales bacterium]|nr:response regulator [Syntrophales bacterium]